MALEDPWDHTRPEDGGGFRFPNQAPRDVNLPAPPVRLDEGTGRGGPCPPGQSRGGHPGNPCRVRAGSGGGGGGGVPGGARPVGPVNSFGADTAGGEGDMASIIWGHIQRALGGYDASTLDRMKGQVFGAAMGRKAAGMDSVNEDLVSRGLARSGIGAEAAINLENTANREYTGGVTSIMIKEVEFKMAALDKAQAHLDSLREYIVSRESNANQREIGLAQIKLGYAKIAAEKEMLKMQLDSKGGGGGGVDPLQLLLQAANMPY